MSSEKWDDTHDKIAQAKQLFLKSDISLKHRYESTIVKIEKILLGLSNDLYKVDVSGEVKYFMKVFGSNSLRDIINRDCEEYIMAYLYEKGQSARIYESNKTTYRIEEFLESISNLPRNMLYDDEIEEIIQTRILEINLIEESVLLQNGVQPLTSIELINKLMKSTAKIETIAKEFNDFFCLAQDFLNTTILSNEKLMVLSHNDVHEGNLALINNKKENLWIIDFEYSTLNYLGFDLANFFFERSLDLAYDQYPFFQVLSNLELLFTDETLYDKLSKFFNQYNRMTGSNFKPSKRYYFELLALSSILWSLVAISCIIDGQVVNLSVFDFKAYTHMRSSVLKLYMNSYKQAVN